MVDQMNHEFNDLRRLVKSGKPESPMDVQRIVEEYFSTLHWSLLKEEYEISMNENQRTHFIEKLFNEVRGENKDEGRRRNQVDL